MNIKLVLKLVGRILQVEAAALIFPLVVALLYREDPVPFLLTIAIVAACGFGLSALPCQKKTKRSKPVGLLRSSFYDASEVGRPLRY